MKSSSLQIADQQLEQIQTRHLGRVFALQSKIRKRETRNLPVDRMRQELESILKDSAQETAKIDASIGQFAIDSSLPIAANQTEIVKLLNAHQVLVVAGETGCGKTTQLPKICLQAGLGRRGLIGHTQPRRVAATSVARRIAEEMQTPLGEQVGYSVRFNSKVSDNTRVKLMTDGVLLSEIEKDPLLSRYQVIIIDEAHERSLNIDFLLGFLKQVLEKRPELKLIITSATIDPESFSRHFSNAPMLQIEGRSYPVEVRYKELDTETTNTGDQILEGVLGAVEECCLESAGDILIFADGEAQIKRIIKQVKRSSLEEFEVLPLYARLSVKEQQKIFADNSKRKIIVATNVAETSLTVPGIIFVIDIGMARISRFSQRNKIQQLPVAKISQASAEQRKGRCGRVAPGICIRLYSEEDFLSREVYTPPEIKRTNLSSVVLRLKAMGVGDVAHFPFMQAPDERAWHVAFSALYELAALNKQQEITDIGRAMAALPVDPQLARILVEPSLAAVDEMLIFCALMSVREVRERPHDRQKKADELHKQYVIGHSDILTAVNLWRQLQNQQKALTSSNFKRWCQDNFINFLGWLEWRRVYFQLKEALEGMGKKINRSEAHADEVEKALIPGFITHVMCKTPEKHYQGVRGLKVWLHPSSLSFNRRSDWLLSAEMIETEKLYARMNALIKPEWIEAAVPHLLKSTYHDVQWHKKRGQVVAKTNITVLGLPVVNQRITNYSSVDAAKTRQVFLKDGLAADAIAENFPFLASNRNKLQALEEMEQRQRLNNIRVNQDSLAALYAKVLPENIVSTVSLKRWLKKDFKQRNRELIFSHEQLTQNRVQSAEDYPAQIKVKGFDLNLSYSFAPGSDEDGVTVEIPAAMVKQFSDRDFDWLVPGYLDQKVLASLKSLPKPIRRELIPLNETAQVCAEQLKSIDQNGKRFVDELAKVLQRQTGKQIKVTDFDFSQVEPFLTMKYRVVDKRSSYRLDSLASIKKQGSSVSATRSTKPQIKAFYDWPDFDFKLEKVDRVSGIDTRVFQALEDCGDSVKVVECGSLAIAEYKHQQGCARLILLQHKAALNKMRNGWPEHKQLERLNLRAGGFTALFDAISMRIALAIVHQRPVAESRAQFSYLNENFGESYRERIARELTDIKPLLKQRESVQLAISDLNLKVFAESIEDMRQQLKGLWCAQSLLTAGQKLFDNYKRYHQGIHARIKRIQTNYPKEQQALEIWQDWIEWFNELRSEEHSARVNEKLSEAFWMLEEFRISLFSPGVKVATSVSSKKLQKVFEAIEDLVEQYG